MRDARTGARSTAAFRRDQFNLLLDLVTRRRCPADNLVAEAGDAAEELDAAS